MNDQLVKLEVSDELIRGIVTKQVTAAMLTAMGGREEFLEKIVTTVMTMKVNAEGKVDSYRNDFQWLDVMVRKMIQEAAVTAIKAWITNNQPAIEKTVQKGFQGQTKQMATAFTAGLLKAIETKWQFQVNVTFNTTNKT